ncbi:MAG TPA: hypothetical protein VGJ37_11270 [Pyrinomonadaceae bacterium]|jgi:hypothetical protein
MKATIVNAIRLLAATILYFICFVVISGALLSSASTQPGPEEAGSTLLALLAVSFINTTVLAYIILRSRWSGWKLIAGLALVFFGVNTLMPQIETAVFVTRLPPGMLPRLFLAGAIIAAVFVPLAVAIFGKARSQKDEMPARPRLNMSASVWIGKLAFIAVAYVIIYFTFGYFIAWQSAAVRAYYGDGELRGFIAHITSELRNNPLLFVLQAVRGLLWAALAVPIMSMMKGKWWEAGLAVALLFGVLMNSQLLLPNPLMPPEVRMAHLLETATSNFLFGWLVVVTLLSSRQ